MDIRSVNKEELSQVMQQYYDIKKNYMKEIVLFQLGDFYEMFFEDAIIVSKELELTLTSKKAGLKERIPMCGIPLNNLDDYLKKLLSFSHTAVIVKQVQDDELGKKLVSRKVSQIVSQGTYIKDETDNNFIGSITHEQKYMLAYGDIATGELYYLESDNFTSIRTEIINQNIKEIITDRSNSLEEIEMLLIDSITIKDTVDITSNINIETNSNAQLNLLKYLSYTQVGKTDQFKHFHKIKIHKYMHLSSNAQTQLEILQTLEEKEYKNSLFWYLNSTSTAMGKRLLKKFLIHPLVNKEDIINRQNIIEKYIANPIMLDDTLDILKQIYDFERLIGKVINNNITPKEIERLKLSLQVLPELYEIIPEEIFALTSNSKENTLQNLYKYLNQSIIQDAPSITKDGGFIKKGFNQEIDELRRLKENSNKWLIDFENQEIEATGIKNLKVKYNKIFGYFIEVTNSNITLVPDYYIEKQTMANCKRYITEKLKEEENKILNARDMLLTLEMTLFTEIKENIKEEILRLQQTSILISTVDVLSSFAINAINNNLVKPIFNEDNKIEIINGRHPVVEKNVENYIKNDLYLDDSKDLLLITGPNMAGKSTYMRMISLIIIMAQIGSYVPADKANLKLISSIFTRIGSGDNLSKGKSTFMVEMLETASALNTADEDSLIIFDELGRGTSTADGIALAQAIINHICKEVKAKTLFSTHYHELVDFTKNTKEIDQVHVKAQEEEEGIKFYHKVMPGSISKSYGIEVAALAGISKDIIQEAKKNYIVASSKEQNSTISETLTSEIDKLAESQKEIKQYEDLLNLINTIDLNNITPIQSLNLLSQIKDKYEDAKK